MFGEVYGQKGKGAGRRPTKEDKARFDHNYSWMGVGALPIALTGTLGFLDDYVFSTPWRSAQTFNSEHIGIIHFCFADGSVRPLEKDIDFDTLINLGGMADGGEFNLQEVY